jgi:Asp-tRNA(Asn)/Glu-tRNA(Gln) amidotransferase B subunit
LEKVLREYCQTHALYTEESKLVRMQAAAEIVELIRNGVLAQRIIRYIAPHFCLNRDGNVKQIKQIKQVKQIKQIKLTNKKSNKHIIHEVDEPLDNRIKAFVDFVD